LRARPPPQRTRPENRGLRRPRPAARGRRCPEPSRTRIRPGPPRSPSRAQRRLHADFFLIPPHAMKLLIADDDTVSRSALKDILKDEPALEIIEVSDGQHALDLICDRLRPDLCIVDIRMPRVDGLQLLQRVRRDPE